MGYSLEKITIKKNTIANIASTFVVCSNQAYEHLFFAFTSYDVHVKNNHLFPI